MIANAAGVISAAPNPCAARAPTSTPAVEANPLTRDAVVKTARPVIRTRRRDSRSAIRPPSSNPPPDISRYAVTTHCRSPLLNCRSAPMVGNAVLTTEMSNTTRTCATNASARTAHDTRSGGFSGPPGSRWWSFAADCGTGSWRSVVLMMCLRCAQGDASVKHPPSRRTARHRTGETTSAGTRSRSRNDHTGGSSAGCRRKLGRAPRQPRTVRYRRFRRRENNPPPRTLMRHTAPRSSSHSHLAQQSPTSSTAADARSP